MRISITFDSSEANSALRTLSAPGLDARLAKVMGQAYFDAIKAWIKGGNSFTGQSGQLEQSIGWRPEPDGAVVFATAAYAPAIEFGSGLHGPNAAPYAIRPKPGRKALKFAVGGVEVTRRGVMHPGVEAQPYFFADWEHRADLMMQSALDELATSVLDRPYTLD